MGFTIPHPRKKWIRYLPKFQTSRILVCRIKGDVDRDNISLVVILFILKLLHALHHLRVFRLLFFLGLLRVSYGDREPHLVGSHHHRCSVYSHLIRYILASSETRSSELHTSLIKKCEFPTSFCLRTQAILYF